MISLLTRARRARQFFPLAPRKQRASQAAKYAKAVKDLGPNWLFIKEVGRIQPL
jgi:hypothetical protein